MSSSTSTSATQQKFTSLRKRLDQLGYRQPLGIESLPLVERLFSDLVHTTESLKKAKLHTTKASSDGGSFESQIEPYKSDNAKLVKENNELHQQLIKTKEELDITSKDLKGSLRRLEHENADLRFLNNQYVHKVRALEKESKSKTDRILQLQEKNFHAVVQTPGGRKKNIPFRRQRMDIDCTVPEKGPIVIPVPSPDDPYVADLLQVADDKIASLSEQARVLEEEKEGLQVKVDSFRKQIDTRDGEIDRLCRQLEGGRPYDVVALESRNRSNERLISHLNIQIDYLQQKNAEVQNQLDDALSNARDKVEENMTLDMRNAELEKELKDVDLMAHRLQLDRDTALRTADREITVAKSELEKSQYELNTMDLSAEQVRAENDRLMREMDEIRVKLKGEMADRQRLDDLLDKIQEDKRRLSNRVNKLTANERELVLEIDRLKHRSGVNKNKRAKSPNRVESFMKGVEEERDYWKGEVTTLQKLIRSMKSTKPRSRSVSPTRSRSRSRATSPNKSKSRNTSPLNTPNKNDKNNHYEAIVRVLEDERDHYKRECDILRALKSRSSSPTRSPSKLSNDNELIRVQRERDELQGLLDKFERHMAEIQANVKVLTSERDKLNTMYEGTREELDRLRQEVVRSPKSPKTSLAAQAVLRRVENERDDAVTELRRMTTDRDSLRERLKIATETHLADRARLEQQIEDMEVRVKNAEYTSSDSTSRTRSLQKLVDSLELKLKDSSQQVVDAREDAAKQRSTATQMRLLAEQTERNLEDAQRRISQKQAEIQNHSTQLQLTEDKVASMSHYPEEMSKLRITISALDREKDSLQTEIDEKAEKIVQLDEELLLKDKTISELRYNIGDLESALSRSTDSSGAKDREIVSLRRQLDSATEEMTDTGRSREVALRENRRLQDDLATMTQENQNLNGELADAIDEREQLKAQVQDYIIEVKRIEDLLSHKEQDRTNLLEQYRCLTMEAERYETQSHQLESEGSNMRLELMTKDSELRHLRDRTDRLERDLQEHGKLEHSYEMQVSSLTKSIAHLEENLRAAEDDKQHLLTDLSAVRDLCAKIEATKDSLQRQLTSRHLDQEKLEVLVDDMKSETTMLRSQVSTERSSVMNLEGLLQSNREKEFQIEYERQERGAEIQLLKDRLALNETKIDSQSREISALRTKSIEADSECDRLRRQLTHERFEKERSIQELRRNGLAPPGESLSRLNTTSPLTSRARSPSPYQSRSKSPSARAKSPSRKYDSDINTTDKDTDEETTSDFSFRDTDWQWLHFEKPLSWSE